VSYGRPIVAGTGGAAAAGAGAATGVLPVTGMAVGALAALGIVLVLVGFVLVRTAAQKVRR
jgi:hypothetical protein